MQKNIQELLNSLKSEKRFFEEKKDLFIQNFVDKMLEEQSNRSIKMLPASMLLTIGEKLYILLFLCKKENPQNELYNFAYKLAKSKIDLKKVLITATLQLTKEFIDYILQSRSDFEKLKVLLTLIDIYLVYIDKAYSTYYQEIEDELANIKQVKKSEESDIILSLFQNLLVEKKNVTVLDYYKEVPVSCKTSIKKIVEDRVFLDISECNFNIFKVGKEIFLQLGSFPKYVKAMITDIKALDHIEIGEFVFSDLPKEKRRRRFVRVQPKEPIGVEIVKNGDNIKAVMLDISIQGIGVYLENIDKLQTEDEVLVRFELKGRPFQIKGNVRYILKDAKRAGIELLVDTENESELAEYVLERQFEIIKELRI